jgi:hypothetical protein
MRLYRIIIIGAALAGLMPAQPQPPAGPIEGPGGGDPPARVGRLNLINGAVSFRPATVEDWTAAQINYPVTAGDHLWTDTGATAEIHVGSTAIRMDHNTALAVVNLNDQIVQLSVTQGSVQVRMRYLGQDENFEVDTPNAAMMLLRPGDYRINADGDNNVTMLGVRQGDAEVTAGGRGLNVRAGEGARVTGLDQADAGVGPLPAPDGFDDWCHNRDAREDRAVQSARYVPRDMGGYEDLDGNGVWTESPQYGWVWRPTAVAVGWAPYRYGHWAWVAPWGWTWVDDAPWGFAPFHYGRWASYNGAWVWVPGMVTARPVYSPALVAFVGGGGFSVAVGGGGVAAWFALGPGEIYRPAYHVTDVYVRNVNVAYVRDVTVINRVGPVTYVNQGVVGAVTVVPHEVFVGARPVGVAVVTVPQREIIGARVVGYTAPIAPERVSVIGYQRTEVVVHTPPTVVVNRVVVARNAPPPPPVSFAAQQTALRANQGRPLAPQQVETYRSQSQRYNDHVRQVSAPQTFGRPNGGAPANQTQGFGQGQGRPSGQGAGQPQQNTTPMYRNDRPPSAQPQSQSGQQQNNNGPRTFGNPAQGQPRGATPQNTSNGTGAVNNNPATPNNSNETRTPNNSRPRPNNSNSNGVNPNNSNVRPPESRPQNEVRTESRREENRGNDNSGKKSNERTVKKEEKKN